MSTITVPNPGGKMLRIFGRPIKTRKWKTEYLNCADCTFNVPDGWTLVSETRVSKNAEGVVSYTEAIVAREINSNRCVRIANANGPGVPTTEVLN